MGWSEMVRRVRLLSGPLLFLILLAVLAGCGSDHVGPPSQAGNGTVDITGDPGALSPGVTLSARSVSKEDALLASWPAYLSLLAAGEFSPAGVTFNTPLLLHFTLPEPQPPGTQLSLFQLRNNAWEDTGLHATVDSAGRATSVAVTQLGSYALFHPEQRAVLSADGATMSYRVDGIPATVVRNPIILASGRADDPNVIAAAMQITGESEASVLGRLQTFGDYEIQVLELTEDTYITRYWGPGAKLGRFFGESLGDHLLLPSEARRYFALPNENNAQNVTLYRLKRGAQVLYGATGPQVGNPVFGPYATGGLIQFIVPKATLLVDGNVQLNPAVIDLVDEVRTVQQ